MSVSLEDIVSLCKRRGFIYQGSEIYGGLAGTWDWGPLGVRLKQNIQNVWWEHFVNSREDMYPLDSAILMNSKVWEASGHLSAFHDPLVECSNCQSRFREDEIDTKKCPVCGKEKTFSKPRQFNMMLKTHIGPVESESTISYLRPETAQGIFANFKNVVDSFQPDIPFGIAQIGKAFRNEISPRDFIFRVRELEMMEIEYFINPKEKWQQLFDYWLAQQKDYLEHIGIDPKKLHQFEHPDKDRSHYSAKTIDWEFEYPFGKKEITGLAYRTEFDLSAHEKASGKNLKYQPKDGGEPFVPHVLEPTFGVERSVLAVLTSAYSEDEQGGEKRIFLKLPKHIAPIKAAVFPLLKNKPELTKKATEVYKLLKTEIGNVMWDDNGNIGKRYRRQDEIGTPYCVTIDFDTLKDDTVTVRHRDTTQQKRVKIKDLGSKL
jgi:glycyl-tRNA synthetase